jgi:hypothetical protein
MTTTIATRALQGATPATPAVRSAKTSSPSGKRALHCGAGRRDAQTLRSDRDGRIVDRLDKMLCRFKKRSHAAFHRRRRE